MLARPVLVVALQGVAQTVPDGIIRRDLRQLFQLIHDLIDLVLERLFEIAILLFPSDCAQLQSNFQQLLLDRRRWFGDGFHAVNKFSHNCPRRFGYVLIRSIFSYVQIF